jgi:hypothetical protein
MRKVLFQQGSEASYLWYGKRNYYKHPLFQIVEVFFLARKYSSFAMKCFILLKDF